MPPRPSSARSGSPVLKRARSSDDPYALNPYLSDACTALADGNLQHEPSDGGSVGGRGTAVTEDLEIKPKCGETRPDQTQLPEHKLGGNSYVNISH